MRDCRWRVAVTGFEVGRWVELACLLDVLASKPGNVHRGRDFPDSSFEEFVLSAWSLGGVFARAADKSLGELVLEGVRVTRQVARGNPNLGMVLLLAPLARAMVQMQGVSLEKRVARVLEASNLDDARAVYEAIRLAGAGGMGRQSRHDVEGQPSVTLVEAMRHARSRDSVAAEYAHGYYRCFHQVLPALCRARVRCQNWSPAIVESYLEVLAAVPDTLVARKEGWESARWVSRQARSVLALGATRTHQGRYGLAGLERKLRSRGNRLNPGTTADLLAAGLFLYFFRFGAHGLLDSKEGGDRV